VKAYVDDYFFHQSLLEVTFVDKNGVDHPMTWDAENSYFYCDCPYDYIMYGNEKIIALTPMHDPDKPGEWKTVMEASNIGYDPCKFKDMGDGTIRDNETGLYWLKTADCTELVWVNSAGKATWQYAKLAVGSLTNNTCGLSDGSRPGDWRLPTVEEWDTLTNRKYYKPALTNTRGTGQWKQGDPFVITMHSFTQDDEFWTSSLCPASIPGYAIECPDCGEKPISWDIWFGGMNTYADQCDREMEFRVWPVRDGD
jgi:hypothetical protein